MATTTPAITTVLANNTATMAPERQSLTMLRSQYVPMVISTLLCMFAVITNALLIVIIAKTKELHNRSQFIIVSHSFAEMLQSLFGTVVYGRRAFCATFSIPDVSNQLNCVIFQVPFVISAKVAMLEILVLGIDRMLCVGAPITYRQLNPKRYVLGLNLACWAFVLAHVPFQFLGVDKNGSVPVCMYTLAFPAAYRSSDSLEGEIIVALTVFVYALAIGFVVYRYWGQKWRTLAERNSWGRRIKLGAFKMMMTVGCIFVACWGIGQAAIYITNWYGSPSTAAMYGPYISLLLTLNTSSHFFVYYFLSSIFREAAKNVLSRKAPGNAVTNIAD